MKIKDFIELLQNCNPDAELFTEDAKNFYAVTGIIDYTGDEESYIIEQENFPSE